MKNDLILIRHSIPQVDPTQPSHTWLLSKEGRERCKALAKALRPHHPTRIITSTEPKAQETGQIIASELGLIATTVSGIEEHKRSQIGFLDQNTFKKKIAHLLTDPDTLILGDETGREAQKRFTKTLSYLLQQFPDDTLAIVSHGTVLTLFISAYNTLDPVAFWQSLTLPDFLLLDKESFTLKSKRYTM